MRRFVALLGLLSLVGPVRAAEEDEFAKVKIETEKLGDGLHVLFGAGGNIAVSSGKDGVFLVDDQYAPVSEKIKAAVAAISDKPVRFLLNTHWHGDHTGGNEKFGGTGTVIVAHENVRARMSTKQFIELFNEEIPASPAAALPVVTFTDALTLHWNDEEIVGQHVAPAHTDGDTIVYFKKANVIHMGDTYFNGMFPFIDLSSGGNIEGVIAAVDRGLSLGNEQTRYIPGHGKVSSRADLQAYREMLVQARDAVQPLAAGGKTAEEAVAAKPLQALDAKWGQGFIKSDVFVKILHAGLQPKAGK